VQCSWSRARLRGMLLRDFRRPCPCCTDCYSDPIFHC
jgi:hypothetical protein